MRKGLIIFILILLILTGLRLALDPLVEYYAHRALNKIEGYQGSFEDIELSLYQGHYQVKDIRIRQRFNDTWHPFIRMETVSLSLQWDDLLEGELVGQATIHQPVLHIIQKEDQGKTQNDRYWGKRLENMLPLKIKSFEIVNGKVTFQNPKQKPHVDVSLQDIHLVAQDLTNMHESTEELPATLSASAAATGNGQLELDMQMDMIDEIPAFQATFRVHSLALPPMNDFIKSYGHFDVKNGSLSLVSEMKVENRQIQGYVKPVFEDLQIFSLQQEDLKNPGEAGWEAVLGLGIELFENQENEQMTLKVPLKGTLEAPQPNVAATVLQTFQYAFQDAIEEKLQLEQSS